MPAPVPPPVTACLRTLGLGGAMRVTRITGGTGTQVWRLQTAPEPLILRLYPAGEAALVAQRREAAFLRHLGPLGLAVPAVHAAGVQDGTPYLLLSHCPGRPVGEEMRTRPWRAYNLGIAAGAFHARLHQTPVPQGLRSFRAADGGDLELEPALRARLHQAPPLPDTILHLDFHPMNILTDGSQVTGVVDWISAAVGDPRVDFARTVVLLRCPRTDHALTTPMIHGLSRLFEYGWASGYAQACGRHPQLAAALRARTDQAAFLAAAAGMLAREMGRVRRPADLARIHRWARTWTRSARIASAHR